MVKHQIYCMQIKTLLANLVLYKLSKLTEASDYSIHNYKFQSANEIGQDTRTLHGELHKDRGDTKIQAINH